MENKFDIKKVMLSAEPDIFYNLKIDLAENGKYKQSKLELLNYIVDNFDKLKNKMKFINIYVPYEKIPKKEFGYLYNLFLKTNDKIPCHVYVEHQYINDDDFYDEKENVHWELKTIIKANTEIDKVCKTIRDKNFSPFEALAYIHNYVSNIANYNMSHLTGQYWYSADQFFAGAYKDLPEIVCAGYSSLMKEIIDNLNMPGLKCEMISLGVQNTKKDYYARHSRCYISIKDTKYGLDQSVFDDPTWDNDANSKCSKYAHFAMPNDCHERERNNNYIYNSLTKYSHPKSKNAVEVIDFNCYRDLYNKSQNQIDQKMIETAYANIMHKIYPNQSPNQIYNDLKLMARESYKEQMERYFIGYIKQPNLMLKKKDIYEICGKTQTESQSQEL